MQHTIDCATVLTDLRGRPLTARRCGLAAEGVFGLQPADPFFDEPLPVGTILEAILLYSVERGRPEPWLSEREKMHRFALALKVRDALPSTPVTNADFELLRTVTTVLPPEPYGCLCLVLGLQAPA